MRHEGYLARKRKKKWNAKLNKTYHNKTLNNQNNWNRTCLLYQHLLKDTNNPLHLLCTALRIFCCCSYTTLHYTTHDIIHNTTNTPNIHSISKSWINLPAPISTFTNSLFSFSFLIWVYFILLYCYVHVTKLPYIYFGVFQITFQLELKFYFYNIC